MSRKNQTNPSLGPKAMEMVMRDVLGGMEELAVMKSHEAYGNVFEILEITSTSNVEKKNNDTANKADVIPIYPTRKNTI